MSLRINFNEASELAKRLEIGSTMAHMFEDDSDLSRFEHFTHEVMHALSLGLRIDPGRIKLAKRIEMMLGEHKDGGAAEEAKVLAAESIFFAGLGESIDEDELSDVAHVQCVSDEVLEHAKAAEGTRQLVGAAIVWMVEREILVDDGQQTLFDEAAGGR